MHEFSLEFLHCPKCSSKIECDVLKNNSEIEEGFLNCYNCNLKFPIINKIPIIWNDFIDYISMRPSLGGELMLACDTIQMKKFIKKSLSKTKSNDDQHIIEKRWFKIYQENKQSKFYSVIKKKISSISANFVLDYGCSIGIMSNFLANNKTTVFGIDRSFVALVIAKKYSKKNTDYFVANIPNNIFGKTKFNLILGLNILELVEPTLFLDKISKQIANGHLVLTDPYDYDRGIHSVKKPLNEVTLRQYLTTLGFDIVKNTQRPANLEWKLKLNPRASLNYKVDVVVAKKT